VRSARIHLVRARRNPAPDLVLMLAPS